MPSRHDPAQSLADIIENARRIAEYLTGIDRATFERRNMVHDAVERCLARICEAGARLGDRAEELVPGQPWAAIRGFGNRLRHAYDGLDDATVWETAVAAVPNLALASAEALRRLDAERSAV